MRIIRFAAGKKTKYGLLEGDTIKGIKGDIFRGSEVKKDSFTPDGSTYTMSDVRLLAPCLPSKIVCLGLNYMLHAREINVHPPPLPLLFLKPPSSVIGPDESIVLPRGYTRVDYEAELAVVIGKKAKYVPEDRASEYILGYTCLNDVTERDNQKADGQWTRAKSYDTFAPLGPYIVTGIDPGNLKIELYLNSERKQSSSTIDLIHKIPRIISFISGIMTLLPGDVIATGTPQGISAMKPGDVAEVRIENIGTLRNKVAGPYKSR